MRIYGQNTTGTVIPAGSAVRIGNLIWGQGGHYTEPIAARPVFALTVPTRLDASCAVALESIAPGCIGRAARRGMVNAQVAADTGIKPYIDIDGDGILRFTSFATPWRTLCGTATGGWSLLALDDPLPEYGGFFKIVITENSTWRVVDGATYNPDAEILSGDSVCRVNNAVFRIPPYEGGSVSDTEIYLEYDRTSNAVTIRHGVLPDDTGQYARVLLGRIIESDAGIFHAVQDNQSGCPQLWLLETCV